jgi:hypothetical protein
VPKQIDYADTSRVSVIVSDFGAVTQVTDENLTVILQKAGGEQHYSRRKQG